MALNNSEEKASDFLANVFRRTFADVRVLRNVLMRLPASETMPTAEFDTIVVCNAGIYCFEIKNWNNCDVVREKQIEGPSHWYLDYGDGVRVKVNDPVAQGGLKVRALRDYFESQVQVRYYVLLPSLNVRLGAHITPCVLCAQDLPYMVRTCRHQAKAKSKSKDAKPLLTTDEVNDISTLISKLSDGLTHEDHIASCCAFEEQKKQKQQQAQLEACAADVHADAELDVDS